MVRGLAESVWHADYMKNIPTNPTDKNTDNMVYVLANWSRMQEHGQDRGVLHERLWWRCWVAGHSGDEKPEAVGECKVHLEG